MSVLYYCPQCDQVVDVGEHECHKGFPNRRVLQLLAGAVLLVPLAGLIGSVV